MKKLLLLLFILALCRGAYAGPGSTGMDFLKLGTGARQSGLGGAAAALADDVYSMRYNPAGLALLERNEAAFTHMIWFEDISYDSLYFAAPVKNNSTFGGSVSLLSHGSIQGYDAGGVKTEGVSAYDLVVTLSAGKSVSRWGREGTGLFAGANLKLIQERLDDVSATTLALDIGGLYVPGWDVAGGSVRLGACVENVGAGVKFIQEKGSLPLNLRFGMAYKRAAPAGEFCVSVDGNVPLERDFYFCCGFEYWYGGFIALRAGYSSENNLNDGFSFGLGVKSRLESGLTFQFDHALVPYGKLGNTHRISVRLSF